MTVAVQTAPVRVSRRAGDIVRDYVALTKPRIIVLLEITTLLPMVIAAHGWPSTSLVVMTLLGGWLSAAGANTINCWFDRDIDAEMGRTRRRPLPDGRIQPAHALIFGVALGIAAFVVMWHGVNLLAALLSLGGYLFYAIVYTMLLKRSSAQNIVIGGAAGAVPPLVGWAAVTGNLSLTAVFLFAVVFFWTPPHFWALSLLIRRDYMAARVPMLPAVAGERFTQQSILHYTWLLAVVTMLPFVAHSFGLTYLAGALILNAGFLALAWRVVRRPSARGPRRLYYYSLLYLALLFAVMALDAVIAA